MKRKLISAAISVIAGGVTLFGADHTLKWSYDDSKHPVAVKTTLPSSALDPSFDSRLCIIVYGPFGLPPGLMLIFK